jgi:hypothetical protein
MIEIKLEPSLTHCVETVAKREYERVLSLLIKGEREDKQLEEKLELLRRFLESADFSRLRSRCDALLFDGKQIEFRLNSTTKTPGYEIEINEIQSSANK